MYNMGFRFRKSVRLGKSVRLNFSSKGMGYSIGRKGFRYTKSANGKHYNTYSIPGTGISYRQSLDTKAPKKQTSPANSNAKARNGKINIPVLVIFLLIIAGVVISFTITGNKSAKTTKTPANSISQSQFTPVQLLTLQDHPYLFDSVNSFHNFYDNVGDNRIQIITNQQHERISMNRTSFAEDKNVLYLIKGDGDVDHLEFNIVSSEAASLTDKDVAQIVLRYLPDGFWDYYKPDCAYTYSNQEVKVYTYSSRLNKSDEVKYAEAKSKGYPFYFHFKIFNYENGLYWRGETGFSAYGGVDKGKVDKFAKWDITV